jgi:hypothetical protein
MSKFKHIDLTKMRQRTPISVTFNIVPETDVRGKCGAGGRKQNCIVP